MGIDEFISMVLFITVFISVSSYFKKRRMEFELFAQKPTFIDCLNVGHEASLRK